MAIDWQTPLATLNAALPSANATDRAIGTALRDELQRAGNEYRQRAARNADAARVESSAHIAWRAAMQSALEELQEIAAHADGDPVTSIAGDLNDAAAATRARLEAALAGAATPAIATLVEAALAFAVPREPQFYEALYYKLAFTRTTTTVVNGKVIKTNENITNGMLVEAVLAAIAAGNEWLTIV